MQIGGISIILLLGVVNALLLLFQLLSGFRVIKVSYSIHKKTGILLFFTAFIHGALGIVASL